MNKPSADMKTVLSLRDDDHSAGPDTALITAVAYRDFACPYCGRAYPVIKRLRARLGDRLRFVFRHFPLVNIPWLSRQLKRARQLMPRINFGPCTICSSNINRLSRKRFLLSMQNILISISSDLIEH